MKILTSKWLWMPLAGVTLVAIVFSFFRKDEESTTLPFSDVVRAGQDGELESIKVSGDRLEVTLLNDQTVYESRTGEDADVTQLLLSESVALGEPDGLRIRYEAPSSYGNIIGLLISFSPLIIFPIVTYYAMRNGVREGLRRRDGDQAVSPASVPVPEQRLNDGR